MVGSCMPRPSIHGATRFSQTVTRVAFKRCSVWSCPQIGRIDAQGPDPADRLPQENFNSVQLKATFQAKGFSTRDLVALSGAHTVGGKGFGNPTAFDNEYFKVLLRRPWEQPG